MNRNNEDRAPAPTASLLTASCAMVGLAYWMGAAWLENPVLGIPGGLWAVAVVFAGLRWGERLVLDSWLGRIRDRGTFGLGWLRRRIPGLLEPVAEIPERVVRAAHGARSGWTGSQEDRSGALTYGISEIRPAERAARGGRIRVGIDLSDHLANRLMHTSGAKRIDWVMVRENGLRSQELCRLHRLDAVVHRMGESICATPAESGPLEPNWQDWAVPVAPITYGSVFPMRPDASCVSVGDTTFSDPVEREIAATMIEALVHLSHAPLRVGPGATAPASEAMRHLARLIVDREATHGSWAGYRAACRAVSAWLSVTPVEWGDRDILETLGACQRTLVDEPEVLLRGAAVRFVLGDDAAGLDAVREADAILATSERASAESQLLFVQSELSMGGDDPLAFGRIAAGLCLCASSCSAGELAYLRDDLMDEARFTEWLIGRDAERFVLMQVFRELQRRREERSLFHAA